MSTTGPERAHKGCLLTQSGGPPESATEKAIGEQWQLLTSNYKRNPPLAHLRHVGGVVWVGAEKALLDEAFDEHPENG